MLRIIWLMMKEEFRFHTNFASKANFLFFPALALLAGVIGPLGLPNLSSDIGFESMVLYIQIGIFFYGFSVGSLTFFGKDYIERRFGHVTFLRFTPRNLPWGFRKAYAAYFIQDIVFYMLITVLPLTAGGYISAHIIRIPYSIPLLFGFTLFLAFSLGMCLSFFSAAVYSRGNKLFLPFVVVLISTIVAGLYLSGAEQRYVLPSSHFFLTSDPFSLLLAVAYILALFTLGIALIREHYGESKGSFTSELPALVGRFKRTKGYSLFLAKEILDIKRSSTMSKILFSTVMPLSVITGLTWFIERGFDVPLGFNTIFYAGLIGYFQVITYSWLTNTDNFDYYETMPLTVNRIVKTKIVVCVIIASAISLFFVTLISVLFGEIELLPLAIPVMIFNVLYSVTVIAYLTGLRTNSALFDIKILAKFSIFAMCPLMLIMVQSRLLSELYLVTSISIIGVCLIMGGIVILLYRAIDKKWRSESFI